jgi:hypothetical protein
MQNHIAFALAHPVFDPDQHILPGHSWIVAAGISATMTVNIGME